MEKNVCGIIDDRVCLTTPAIAEILNVDVSPNRLRSGLRHRHGFNKFRKRKPSAIFSGLLLAGYPGKEGE